ncbi:hypothetical protein ACRAWF_38350 [Streptomyces sp. L7]
MSSRPGTESRVARRRALPASRALETGTRTAVLLRQGAALSSSPTPVGGGSARLGKLTVRAYRGHGALYTVMGGIQPGSRPCWWTLGAAAVGRGTPDGAVPRSP